MIASRYKFRLRNIKVVVQNVSAKRILIYAQELNPFGIRNNIRDSSVGKSISERIEIKSAEDTSLSGDTTLAAGEELDLITDTSTGDPTWATYRWTYTRDD